MVIFQTGLCLALVGLQKPNEFRELLVSGDQALIGVTGVLDWIVGSPLRLTRRAG